MTASPAATEPAGPSVPPGRGNILEVFLVALRLGFTSFGGPVAHLGYFREEYVQRRRWLDDAAYADLVALCQFLPGPASSQVGIAIGALRAGWLGGFVAWFAFTAPSAIALVLFGLAVEEFELADAGWLHGLKIAAVAVVANAIWGMARNLTPDRERITLAVIAAAVVLIERTALTQVLVIVAGAAIGWRLFPAAVIEVVPPTVRRGGFGMKVAVAAWVLFFGLLIGLPIARQFSDAQPLALFDSFYRAGSLVFGGGHVVLPLIESEVVTPGWLSRDEFIAGYGAAQAVPGPLFAFSAYLGAIADPRPNGWAGASIALGAIYLPSFLLLAGTLPLWERLRARPEVQSSLKGVGAAVVGLLVAAMYEPVWTSAILAPKDFALALVAFGLLIAWWLPAWAIVLVAAAGGELIAATA
ncbi:MAG: chromate efflux transporter [Chloroflexi bacterium]|nr:chromate efflux transporter [Chloroflexota bacterium]MDA1145284.1 chromate efflux transporter [Chloroflexota bacterium]